MRSAVKMGSLWAWLILLVAGLGPVHAFVDEALDACPIAKSEAHEHGHDHEPDRDVSESEPCHDHCAIGRAAGPSRTFSVAIATFADLPAASVVPLRIAEFPIFGHVAIEWASLRAPSSAYHQRTGLRLYA